MIENNLSQEIQTAVNTNVLVIGGGWTGLKAASEIAELGYDILLLTEDETSSANAAQELYARLNSERKEELEQIRQKVDRHKRIECLMGADMLQCSGMPGNFHFKMLKNAEVLERSAGSVVVATDIQVNPLFEAYGLTPSDRVISQSQIEDWVHGQGEGKSTLEAGQKIAFLVGFAQEGNPLVMHRVLQSVSLLEEKGCQVYIYVNNLKVAAEGLERLYKANRDQGAIFFKLQEKPRVEAQGQSIVSHDPVLGTDIELSPDLIVVEEQLSANQLNPELAEVLRVDLGPWDFLQEDNVHRFPVYSNRQGMFLVGEARDTLNMPGLCTDVANAVLEVHNFLGKGQKTIPAQRGEIDREKCCFCLTCFRSCPHGAIYWEDKPIISAIACQGCGICASECPQDAIQIVTYPDDDMILQIDQAMQELRQVNAPWIIAFCCENSSWEAAEMAREYGLDLPAGLRIIRVPCAGKIDLDYIFHSLLKGADGVLVASCHTGNCKSVRGNTFAQWRVENVGRMLQEAGLEAERLQFSTFASNTGHDFARKVQSFEQELLPLGNSPLR